MRFTLAGLQQLLIGILSAALTACMVGPDFESPTPPNTQHYTKSPLPTKTTRTPSAGKAGKAQQFNLGQDIPAEWWRLFHSPELNGLITAGIANSPTLAAAKATLHQAEQNLNAQFGALLLPSVGLNLAGERQRFSDQQFGISNRSTIFNTYNMTFNAAYTLDIFGGARRQIEALRAQVDYERYELIASYLTLTTNIVTTAVTVASLQAQIKTTRQLIKTVGNELGIMKKQFSLGGISKENVLSQETLLAQTIATLPPLKKSLAQSQHALAVLVGGLPSETQLPYIDLEKLTLPTELPVSLPSNLVRQRPDVQASEALLHEASAQIGVATANLLPQFTITGTYGWTALTLQDFFSSTNNIWSYGTQIAQPLFKGGSLISQRRAAVAAFEAACAQYRQTVLQAFQNVADALLAIEMDAQELQAQKQAEKAAKNTLNLTQQQLKLGAINYLTFLNAEQQYQQIIINRIQAQAARYNDTAALFQALGGGWWNRPKGI